MRDCKSHRWPRASNGHLGDNGLLHWKSDTKDDVPGTDISPQSGADTSGTSRIKQYIVEDSCQKPSNAAS